MNNSEQSAFPIPRLESATYDKEITFHGLTKREYFAGLAMQGMVSSGWNGREHWGEIARQSIAIADELLKELEQ